VNAREISEALRESVRVLVSAVQDVLIHMPDEYAADIKKLGIRLTGGCSLLSGLSEALAEETGLTVEISATPQDDVANGLGLIGRDERLLRELIAAGSAVE
jgi:rod shape-determining protein MreB